MSSLSTYSMHQALPHTPQSAAIDLATAAAQQLYNRTRIRGALHRAWSALSGRSTMLQGLHEIETSVDISGQRDAGTQAIPINRIRGSESRSADFDANFRPRSSHTKSRWLSVAIAWMLGRPLPPIDVILIDDTYFVRDGHHRVSVARALGQVEIDARVTVWQTRPQPVDTSPAADESCWSCSAPALCGPVPC